MSQAPKKPNQLENLPRGLIGRGGIIVSQNTRLPSLRTPRDLTLGGHAKRTFAPTIAAANKPKVTVKNENVQNEFARPSPSTSQRGRGRGAGDKNRGRGRGRGRGMSREELLGVSGGLFSEGLAPKGPKQSFEREVKQSTYTSKVKLEVGNQDFKDSLEEEQYVNDRLKHLYCDDFIDDGDLYADADAPIKLPFTQKDLEHMYKQISEAKVKTNDEVKTEVEDFGNVKIKAEPITDHEYMEPEAIEIKPDSFDGEMFSLSLLTNICKTGKDELIIVRVPDNFQTLVNVNELSSVKQEPQMSYANAHREDIKPNLSQIESKLTDVGEGYLGKIQILRSGKTRFVIGNTYLDVDLGEPCEFLQDIVSVRTLENPNGKFCSVAVRGHSRYSLICSPDLENCTYSEDTNYH